MMVSVGPLALLVRLVRLTLLVPFVMLALLGQGVMPQTTVNGLTLVLCSVDGPVERVIDPATGEPADPVPVDSCDWAAAQGLVLLPDAKAPTPPVTLRRSEPPLHTIAFAPAHDPRGLYARGPPTLS